MKLIVHIGQSKTGTTSIQRYLRKNQEAILRQGFLYPASHLGGPNHAILTVPLFRKVQRSLVARTGKNYEAALETSYEAWESVARQVRDAQPDTVILSSEFLFNVRNPQLLVDLIRKYIGDVRDLTFIAYLRMRSQHYPSAMQQKLKASHKIPHLDAARSPVTQLESYSTIGEVVARKFARDQLKNGDVTEDICDVLGIKTAGFKDIPAEANTSVSAEGIILLQEYRETHHGDRNNVFTADTKDLLKKIAAEESKSAGTYTRPRLRPEIAQALDQETDDTRKLKARFGVDLSFDHGVAAMDDAQLAQIERAAQVLAYDPDLLARMRTALG